MTVSKLWLAAALVLATLVVFVVWLAWDRPAFFSGLLGALIGAAASIAGIELSQRYSRDRDRENYRRAVTTATVERLRAHYVALVHAVQALEEASQELQLLRAGDTEEQRDARVYEMLRRALEDLDMVIAAVRLERGTNDVLTKWRAALGTFAYVRHILESNARVPRTFSTQDLIEKLNELRRHASDLTDLATSHLERLERKVL